MSMPACATWRCHVATEKIIIVIIIITIIIIIIVIVIIIISEEVVKSSLSPRSLRAAELASEKGVSSWLTVIPIKDQGYDFNKRAFEDAIKMRYN